MSNKWLAVKRYSFQFKAKLYFLCIKINCLRVNEEINYFFFLLKNPGLNIVLIISIEMLITREKSDSFALHFILFGRNISQV